jgi:hypothetical protein
VLGYEGLSLASARVLSRPIEVTLWYGSVLEGCRREQCVGIAVLVDELLRHDPEDLCPNFTNGVDTPVTRLVKGLVRRRINGLIL